MKIKEDNIVPLSRQAVAVLREQFTVTGSGKFVFLSLRGASRCISDNTINAALRGLGYGRHEMTGHAFRTTASTLLNELGFISDVIERQLPHSEQNKVKASYNRAAHLPEQRRMMQTWAVYPDKLRKAAR